MGKMSVTKIIEIVLVFLLCVFINLCAYMVWQRTDETVEEYLKIDHSILRFVIVEIFINGILGFILYNGVFKKMK